MTKMNATGTGLVWSTFLGGSKEDHPYALHLEPDGNVVVGGRTESLDFPVTPGAFQAAFAGPFPSGRGDAFVSRLDRTGSRLLSSTYLGGEDTEGILGVTAGPSGVVTVTGWTESIGYPTSPGAFSVRHNLSSDVMVTRLDPSFSRLLYSTFLGSTRFDNADGIVVDAQSRVSVAGHSEGADYPTTPGAFRPSYTGGGAECVLTTMDLLLEGVRTSGVSKPYCGRPLVMNALEQPVAGASGFGFYCEGAPPLATGWLLMSLGGAPRGTTLGGRMAMLRGASLSIVLPATSDARGYAETSVPLPVGTTGTTFSGRYVFKNGPSSCPDGGSRSWSQRVFVTVQ